VKTPHGVFDDRSGWMLYRCISADCHIDLNWMPHDLFVANASTKLKDRMPYVADGPDGLHWTTRSGLELGLANGRGSEGVYGGTGRKYVPGKEPRIDRIASTGLYSDGAQGIFRPTTPELRLADQDRDGIQAEVLYGLLGVGNKMPEREIAVEFYRIYNDWLAGFCSYDRRRYIGLACIPTHSVEAAVSEIRHAARLGLGGLDVSITHDMIPLWNPYWDPMWRAAAEANVPVHFHSIGPRPEPPPPAELPESAKVASRAVKVLGLQQHIATLLGSVVLGGALEHHPNLRIVLGESGIGWIPFVLDRMDHEYESRFRDDLPLRMKPSEYWRRQCKATFQYDRIGAKLLDDLGVETAMWGSDYPHPDGVFPDSQHYIERQFSHLPADVQRKLVCENAGRFYGLM
jgi:predicted TIM-barrel fold metal-dependent hydrolase